MAAKKCILFVFIFVLSISQLFAEEKNEIINIGNNFVGFNASSLSGVGVCYQYAFTEKYAIKVDGVGYLNRKQETDDLYPGEKRTYDRRFWVVGGEIQRNFFTVDAGVDAPFTLYSLLGGSYWYSKVKYPFHPEDNVLKKYYSIGAGIGARLILRQRIYFDVSFVFQYNKYLNSIQQYLGPGGGCSAGMIF